jgi:hypothetical protein
MKFFKQWLTVFVICISMLQYSTIHADELQTQEDMIAVIKNALEGFGQFYAILSPSEQEDLTRMFDDLISMGCQIQEYCDTGLKHNSLMLNYKNSKNLEQLCLNASFGCTAKNDEPIVCRDITLLEHFDCASCLQDSDLNQFYSSLNLEEQEELRTVIMDMFLFCKKTVHDLTQLLDHYPVIKSKLQTFIAEVDQELLVTIGFDYPFPSITYKIA